MVDEDYAYIENIRKVKGWRERSKVRKPCKGETEYGGEAEVGRG